MKLSEMVDNGPPLSGDPNSCIAPYLINKCPKLIQMLQITAQVQGVDEKLFVTSVVSGMDIMVRYLQMYGLPDDTGQLLEEVV